jgi:hypothetical protein
LLAGKEPAGIAARVDALNGDAVDKGGLLGGDAGRSTKRFPSFLASRAIASAPRMGRVDPDRLSSPAIRQSSAISSWSWRLAARSARAIGRS